MHSNTLAPEFTEHLQVAQEFLAKHGVELLPHQAFLSGCVEFGPQVVVTHLLELGPGEMDHIVVVGMYIPHDGNCTTVINTMDGAYTLDNANELFPG